MSTGLYYTKPYYETLHMKTIDFRVKYMSIDEAKLAEYRLTWQKRTHQAARSAAGILREQFGASRVRLFGSLLYPQSFHKHSDIDLAVEGMDLSLVLKAWCAVSASAPDFEFDLVTPDECRPEIWTSIESEGIEL